MKLDNATHAALDALMANMAYSAMSSKGLLAYKRDAPLFDTRFAGGLELIALDSVIPDTNSSTTHYEGQFDGTTTATIMPKYGFAISTTGPYEQTTLDYNMRILEGETNGTRKDYWN